VTEEFGSAVRISTVLTNTELDFGTPIDSSRCGSCNVYKNVCLAGAISGEHWDVKKDRDEFYNITLYRILHLPYNKA
jgi:epoxyqueuosine reductase